MSGRTKKNLKDLEKGLEVKIFYTVCKTEENILD